jgi:hypothetical protein
LNSDLGLRLRQFFQQNNAILVNHTLINIGDGYDGFLILNLVLIQNFVEVSKLSLITLKVSMRIFLWNFNTNLVLI